jgi:ABC-type antimicrobial peptide transport system permease subunit
MTIRGRVQELAAMKRLRISQEDFTVTSQDARLTRSRKILNFFSWVLGAIAAIFLGMGGPTREIGRYKAVGARRRDILSQVLLEAVT